MKPAIYHTYHPKNRPEEVMATKMMLSSKEEEDRQTMGHAEEEWSCNQQTNCQESRKE